MHHRLYVVAAGGCGGGTAFFKVAFHTGFNIFEINAHVGIAVGARLFVLKTEGVN